MAAARFPRPRRVIQAGLEGLAGSGSGKLSPSPMALTLGTRIGVFEVTGSLGAGGMGEVYRARDTRLDREVAIKILPEPSPAIPSA